MTIRADGFSNLIVYQKASAVAARVFDLSKSFPREELYSLTDQVRRSSRSVGAQIAEAWGKRRFVRHFVSKLTDAEAERLETQRWLLVARQCGYLQDVVCDQLFRELEEVGRMLHAMMKADEFCPESFTIRDSDAEETEE